MIFKIIRKLFQNRNERILNKYKKILKIINQKEKYYQNLSNKKLSLKTKQFKNQIKNGTSINDILTDAFAVVREVSKRIIKLRHYDVQILGGIALHYEKAIEMHTGEGKTLVSTLPAYLNALIGSVHIITANEYLAKRDAQWMKPIYSFLGLKINVNLENLKYYEKQKVYKANIIYGTSSEFGFDYLRDNIKNNKKHIVQNKLTFAIIDEIDSILIDESRVPLIISEKSYNYNISYKKINHIAKYFKINIDYIINKKTKQIYLTENGQKKQNTYS